MRRGQPAGTVPVLGSVDGPFRRQLGTGRHGAGRDGTGRDGAISAGFASVGCAYGVKKSDAWILDMGLWER